MRFGWPSAPVRYVHSRSTAYTPSADVFEFIEEAYKFERESGVSSSVRGPGERPILQVRCDVGLRYESPTKWERRWEGGGGGQSERFEVA